MNEFLAGILEGINTITSNYGWSIVLFTLLIRVILFPLDYKSRKSMRKTQQLQPQMDALKKKYANDKEKFNQKLSELYRKEHINPLSGCLPLLLSFPVLIAMFGAMRLIANRELAQQAFDILSGQTPVYESWLWVRNLWMPDSPFATLVPDVASLNQVPRDVWQWVYERLPEAQAALVPAFDFSEAAFKTTLTELTTAMQSHAIYTEALAAVPGWSNISLLLISFTVYVQHNGLFLLPILAAVTQLLVTMLTPQQSQPSAQGQGGTGAFMKWFFPIFSLFICSSSNAGFALYWVMANVIAGAQTYFLNLYFDAKDKKAAQSGIGEDSVK